MIWKWYISHCTQRKQTTRIFFTFSSWLEQMVSEWEYMTLWTWINNKCHLGKKLTSLMHCVSYGRPFILTLHLNHVCVFHSSTLQSPLWFSIQWLGHGLTFSVGFFILHKMIELREKTQKETRCAVISGFNEYFGRAHDAIVFHLTKFTSVFM